MTQLLPFSIGRSIITGINYYQHFRALHFLPGDSAPVSGERLPAKGVPERGPSPPEHGVPDWKLPPQHGVPGGKGVPDRELPSTLDCSDPRILTGKAMLA
jgi:hypothetical protein